MTTTSKIKKGNPKCNHNWHIVNSIEDYFRKEVLVTFICDKCEKLKRVKSKW